MRGGDHPSPRPPKNAVTRGASEGGIVERRPPRASGRLALHVLEVLEATLDAAASGTSRALDAAAVQPWALPEAEAVLLAASAGLDGLVPPIKTPA